jgi:hypothetical protein
LQLFLNFLCCQLILGELCLTAVFYRGVFDISGIPQIKNKIFLQRPRAEKALHCHRFIEQALITSPRLLVIFFAVLAHLVFVNSDPAAHLALRTSKEKLCTYMLFWNKYILL